MNGCTYNVFDLVGRQNDSSTRHCSVMAKRNTQSRLEVERRLGFNLVYHCRVQASMHQAMT